ncbi:hypothetical protein [Legionella micdadei]|uniref:Uncharacterized protein n=1 Tax=Legionella micdadei TaxID=451 RepID=A0A098GG52_LEGMI|nr:hypothetical protein [Legionella micdadei]KTD27546.1 hypothetical protein Lmic_1866 [Legionella micdadei]CEG60965.1 protein of unknown function [Legionella micdadei]SCY69651.1 hypothetical protein SAMN02982997_02536 [Legionella micdadei]
MIVRGQNFRQFPLNIVGSSTFGRYPKISIEKTYNMFVSDSFMVPYAGYKRAISSAEFLNGKEGRAVFTSTKFNRLVIVIGAHVFLVNIVYSQKKEKVIYDQVIRIGTLQTQTGVVYIAENNKPQIGFSDGTAFYIYDPTLTPSFQSIPLDFVPGYLTFHDTYFILAASDDTYNGAPVNNTWRLSSSNDGTSWPSTSSSVGLLQTKPDNTQAVVRFPSKGNMIFVMGSIVTEAWFDTGAQLFPYQRNNQFNIDYGCLQPATVAYMDEFVVWLAKNEKSGPIIMYSDGGMPRKITTDGIDYLFSTLQNPEDSQAFLYRQDGHLFYHINFYSDNLSLFYDFMTDKFYHACDQNLNYFIAAEVAFFNNQYYFVTKNNGNLFAFDTSITTYDDVDSLGNLTTHEIPRIRTCKNIRTPEQDYQIINDIGFTIESGETDYQQQSLGNILLITQDKKILGTQGDFQGLATQDAQLLKTQDNKYIVTQQTNLATSVPFIAQQEANTGTSNLSLPHVDLSISTDGGATFGNEWAYYLPPIGVRKNRLMWWQAGIANDFVPQFKFWGMGRFVATDGIVNTRT